MINALQVETDGQNTHMLLGGLLLSVQDSTIFEENENTGGYSQTSQQNSDTNLLSSGFCILIFNFKFIFFLNIALYLL